MKKMSNPVHFEKTLSSETLFEGRVITLTKDTALLENGRTATREVVHHHGGACIVPYFADGTICMVRQFRYAMQQELWELPAGKLEKGEDPFEAAKRELEEECGLTADHRNLLNAIERCDLAAFEPLVERHLYGGIRRLGSKLTGEYADYFEPEPEK